MGLLQDLLGSVQNVTQNAIPDSSDLMQNALNNTIFNDAPQTAKEYIQSPRQ